MKAARLLLLFLIAGPGFLFAQDSTTCQTRYKLHVEEFSTRLDRLERAYMRYRWTEAQIRQVLYDLLWKARTDANHPLDKARRAAGREEEEKHKTLLDRYLKQSEKDSIYIWKALKALDEGPMQYSNLCERPDFIVCMNNSFKPVFRTVEAIRQEFHHILEGEREYRTRIETITGGKEGLYPQDTVEPESQHNDYYWRFENELSQKRFLEDARIMAWFGEIRETLNWKFSADDCCIMCS